MKKNLLVFILFFTFAAQGWGDSNYDCSTTNNAKVRINQIYNPQTGNEIGYLELFVDNGPVNLHDWNICYGDGSHNKCIKVGEGHGDVYVNGVQTGTDNPSTVPDNAFIVFSETLFSTSDHSENTFAQAKGEAILFDSNGNVAHYLRYHNNNFNNADWNVDAECTTDYLQSTANNNGICAIPDFSQPSSQWNYNCADTMGTYNADPAIPVSEWRMDECLWNGTAGEVKDSQSANHGTSKALNSDSRVATTADGGAINSAGEFKGEGYNAAPNDTWYQARYYVEIPDSDSLSPLSVTQAAKMSITGWLKLNNTTDTHTIVHKGGPSQEYRVYVEGGKLKFTVWNIWGGSNTIVVNQSLNANQYYFFAVTAKLDNWLPIIGGTLTLTASVKSGGNTYTKTDSINLFTYNTLKNENLYFGATNWGVGNITNFLNGTIDEIKIYDKELSGNDITAIYNNEKAGNNYDGATRTKPTCGLLYTFDECTTGNTIATLQDTLGSNNATVYGNVKCIDTGNGNKGGEFDGSTGYALSDKVLNYTYSKGFTVCARMKIQETPKRSWAFWYGIDNTGTCNNNGFHWLTNMRSSGDCGNLGKGIVQAGPFCGAQNRPNVLAKFDQYATYAVSYDKNTKAQKLLIDGVVVDTKTNATDPVSGNTILTVGKPWSGCGGSDSYFKGVIAALKIVPKTLDETGVISECTFADNEPIVQTNFAFDAWDSFRSLNDRNISTKIVNKPFTLTVASLNSTNTALQDFNGTVCATIVNNAGNSISGWNKLLFTTTQSMTSTFNLNRAIGGSDSAGIKLYWKTNVDSTCPLVAENNSTIASDRFSVRPASFALSAPNAVAGVDFSLTFSAPIYGAATPSADYNEIVGSTFDVTVAEHNASCPIGTLTPSLGSGWAFSDGSKTMTTRYNEVGVLDVNISDTAKACAARYANIDCDDANVNDGTNFTADLLPIGLTQKSITIKPDHFDINATLSNFAGGTFTYLSRDANMSAMSADLNITITAQTEGNTTTKNYNTLCYAKPTNYTITNIAPTINPSTNLSSLDYLETNTSKSGSVIRTATLFKLPNALTDHTLVPNTIFGTDTNGSAKLNVKINFNRSDSLPVNPFDLNITSVIATDSDSVFGSSTTVGNATFVYGRVRTYDITTNEISAPNPIEFEVYSTSSSGYVSGMPQNVLKWYRNLNHNTAASGNVIRGGFTAGATNINVDTSTAPQNGIQIVTVTSATNQTVHLDISPWLWYSPKYGYDYSGGCTQHPCFNYNHTTTGGVSGVSSGTFEGSDFNMTPANNITKKGVKVFR